MALKPCRECKTMVSDSAKTCPNCGISKPVKNRRSFLMSIIFLIVIFFIFVPKNNGGKSNSTPPKATAADELACKDDIKCWGEKNSAAADAYCEDAIEKLAKYSHRWTDGMLEPKFSHFRWLNKLESTITYVGDKIEFQNGFGAFQGYTYECDFNPSSGTVLDARAQPGRL
jgi:hypothetical protein